MTEVQMNDAAEWLARLPEPITWHLHWIVEDLIGMDHEEKQDAAQLLFDLSTHVGDSHRGPGVVSTVDLLILVRRLLIEADALATPIEGD